MMDARLINWRRGTSKVERNVVLLLALKEPVEVKVQIQSYLISALNKGDKQ
jgi:hypothetical protein